jgi:hypothetical protein
MKKLNKVTHKFSKLTELNECFDCKLMVRALGYFIQILRILQNELFR